VSTDAAPPPASNGDGQQADKQSSGLRPSTRQAIQVSLAAALAIVAGQLVSPTRWFWAVIATFVIFAGTNSWGETLTKGWQRLIGTMLGVRAACWWPPCSPAIKSAHSR